MEKAVESSREVAVSESVDLHGLHVVAQNVETDLLSFDLEVVVCYVERLVHELDDGFVFYEEFRRCFPSLSFVNIDYDRDLQLSVSEPVEPLGQLVEVHTAVLAGEARRKVCND